MAAASTEGAWGGNLVLQPDLLVPLMAQYAVTHLVRSLELGLDALSL
jgi:hypothetical protein